MSYKKNLNSISVDFLEYIRVKTFAAESWQTVTTAISKTTQAVIVFKMYIFHIGLYIKSNENNKYKKLNIKLRLNHAFEEFYVTLVLNYICK